MASIDIPSFPSLRIAHFSVHVTLSAGPLSKTITHYDLSARQLRVKAAVAANAGFYTFTTRGQQFPFGFGGCEVGENTLLDLHMTNTPKTWRPLRLCMTGNVSPSTGDSMSQT